MQLFSKNSFFFNVNIMFHAIREKFVSKCIPKTTNAQKTCKTAVDYSDNKYGIEIQYFAVRSVRHTAVPIFQN